MKTKLNESIRDYLAPSKWTILTEEENSVVDGERVLARVVGPMSIINGESLNGRHYSESLWEKTIAKVQPRLKEGGIFGTCGHGIALNEDSISNGSISHKVTKLWIDQPSKSVQGEILILGTDAGRNVNLLMREGMNLSVSTRAYGDITPGKGPNGSDLIDEDTFTLESIDFVTNPGVEFARPKIVESINETDEENKMTEKLLESLQAEKTQLTDKLHESLRENKQLSEEVSQLKAEKAALVESLGAEPVKVLKRMDEGLRKWFELEPFKSLAQQTKRFRSNERPTMEAITESLLDILEEFGKLGSPKEISEKLQGAKEITDICESKDLLIRARDDLKAFRAIEKDPAKLKATFAEAKEAKAKYRAAKRIVEAKRIAKVVYPGAPVNVIEARTKTIAEMLKKTPSKEVEANLKKLNESSATEETYRADKNRAGVTIPSKPGVTTPSNAGSAAGRLFESVKEAPTPKEANKAFFERLSKARK